jgi:hypothetical protein
MVSLSNHDEATHAHCRRCNRVRGRVHSAAASPRQPAPHGGVVVPTTARLGGVHARGTLEAASPRPAIVANVVPSADYLAQCDVPASSAEPAELSNDNVRPFLCHRHAHHALPRLAGTARSSAHSVWYVYRRFGCDATTRERGDSKLYLPSPFVPRARRRSVDQIPLPAPSVAVLPSWFDRLTMTPGANLTGLC